jgi:hypothetical protein
LANGRLFKRQDSGSQYTSVVCFLHPYPRPCGRSRCSPARRRSAARCLSCTAGRPGSTRACPHAPCYQNHRHQEFQIKNDATVYPDRLGTKTRKVKWVKTDRGVFSPLHGDADVVLRGFTPAQWHDVAPEGLVAPAGNGLFCQLLLCLSRACLGKSIVCSAKIAPKGCFPYVLSRSESVQGRYGSGQQHM